MANIKVSEMTEATSFDDGDYTMIVQANQNKKISKENIFSNLEDEISANASDISSINTNIGNLQNLDTIDKDNLVNAINSLVPVLLYDNSTGSNAEITLADSTENYSYIEIYYTDNQKIYANSVKINSPNGKSTALLAVATGPSHNRFERLCNYNISTNKISPTDYFYYAIGTNGSISGINYNTNYIYITKVLGYK